MTYSYIDLCVCMCVCGCLYVCIYECMYAGMYVRTCTRMQALTHVISQNNLTVM